MPLSTASESKFDGALSLPPLGAFSKRPSLAQEFIAQRTGLHEGLKLAIGNDESADGTAPQRATHVCIRPIFRGVDSQSAERKKEDEPLIDRKIGPPASLDEGILAVSSRRESWLSLLVNKIKKSIATGLVAELQKISKLEEAPISAVAVIFFLSRARPCRQHAVVSKIED